MTICVTGVAGFIGSNVATRLLGMGHRVIGIDCFTDYYDRHLKELHLEPIKDHPRFEFHEVNLVDFDFAAVLKPGDSIVHEAAQAGVRASWGSEFEVYTGNNVLATQRVLEQIKDIGIKRFVLAGSSSVYGDVDKFPMTEDVAPSPLSPYGVSKLASEHLCMLYYKNFQVPAVSLRYFTVFGPGQRPDMAFHRFCKAIYKGEPIHVYGTGEQTRDFTYIDDIVTGTVAAIDADCSGEVINVGGGSRISLAKCIELIEDIAGKKAQIIRSDVQKGDVRHTAADISKAKRLLNYNPEVSVADGLAAEYAWIKSLLESGYAGS